jgi:hypothetical protein
MWFILIAMLRKVWNNVVSGTMINTMTFAHEHGCIEYFENGVAWLMDGKDDSAYKSVQ